MSLSLYSMTQIIPQTQLCLKLTLHQISHNQMTLSLQAFLKIKAKPHLKIHNHHHKLNKLKPPINSQVKINKIQVKFKFQLGNLILIY